MALAKKTNAPTFEEQEVTFEDNDMAQEVAVEEPEVEVTAETQQKTQEVASTAIAKAKTSALGAPTAPKFSAALQEYENQLDIDSVRALGIGTLPKLSADRGGFELADGSTKTAYGDWLNFQILSFNKRWLASGGIDGEEGKELLRTSYDGETLENETMSVNDYIDHLKENGYEKAAARQYVDVWGFVVDSEKTGAIAEEDYEMIQLQLSPQSVKQFTAYQIQAGVQARLTKSEVSGIVKATIDKREFNGNKYAAIKFSAP